MDWRRRKRTKKKARNYWEKKTLFTTTTKKATISPSLSTSKEAYLSPRGALRIVLHFLRFFCTGKKSIFSRLSSSFSLCISSFSVDDYYFMLMKMSQLHPGSPRLWEICDYYQAVHHCYGRSPTRPQVSKKVSRMKKKKKEEESERDVLLLFDDRQSDGWSPIHHWPKGGGQWRMETNHRQKTSARKRERKKRKERSCCLQLAVIIKGKKRKKERKRGKKKGIKDAMACWDREKNKGGKRVNDETKRDCFE